MLWGFGNLFELDDFSNYRIFGYIREISGKKTIKRGKYSNFENRECLSVTQIYLTIYLHI